MIRPAAFAAALASALAIVFAALPKKKRKMNSSNNSVRQAVVLAAASQLGPQNWDAYCDGNTAQHPGSRVSWCGIFALWALHQAGLALGYQWRYGRGFIYPLGLPRTSTPKPGDIAYFDQPYQHHAIVEKVEGETVHTIDGNQPGETVQRRQRPKGAGSYFSISPLLSKVMV